MGKGAVVVTGAAGNLGRLVVQTLHRDRRVVAVDRRPLNGLPKDVETQRADLRWRALAEVFRRQSVEAVLHLGIMHNPRNDVGCYRHNVVGTQRLLELVAKHRVPRLVMLSSANIYGPNPDNSHFLTEDAPLLGAEHHPEIRDLVSVDNLVQAFFYRHPEVRTVLLRPVHIVGPRVRNAPANYLRLERPWVIMGFDPLVQLVHEDDVVEAMRLALVRDARGVFNIVGSSGVPSASMVSTCLFATELTGNVQERTGAPSTCTVQAPQSDMPQPNLVPRKPSSSRSTQSRGISGSTSMFWVAPLRMKEIMNVSP